MLGQTIKFVKNGRFNWEPKKGELGIVTRILSSKPQTTDDILIVRHVNSNTPVWVTSKDIIPWGQLELF